MWWCSQTLTLRSALLNLTNIDAVYLTLEAYGVPDADVELLRRMQAGSRYSVANSFCETVAYIIEKEIKHGDPTSLARY